MAIDTGAMLCHTKWEKREPEAIQYPWIETEQLCCQCLLSQTMTNNIIVNCIKEYHS